MDVEGLAMDGESEAAVRAEDAWLTQSFAAMSAILEEVQSKGGKALLFCWSGVNRSASLAVVYLMWTQKRTLLDALSVVRQQFGWVVQVEAFQRMLVMNGHAQGLLEDIDFSREAELSGDETTNDEKFTSGRAFLGINDSDLSDDADFSASAGEWEDDEDAELSDEAVGGDSDAEELAPPLVLV